jgi:hypothetical protein
MGVRRARQKLIEFTLTPLSTLVLAGFFASALLVWGVDAGSAKFWVILGALAVPFLAFDVYITYRRKRGLDIRKVSEAITAEMRREKS